MKKILLFGLFFTLIIALSGCETKEDDHAGVRGKGVVPLISDLNPGIFIANDGTSYIQFIVSYSEGESADQTDIVLSRGYNLERVKINDLTTFPSTVKITLSEVAAALGTTVENIGKGETVFVEVETTKDGVKTRSTVAALSIGVVCPFDKSITYGSYHSVSPASEWNSQGDVVITADANDPYTIYVSGLEALEGFNEDLGPLPMHINPSTFAVTVDPTIIVSDGDYGSIQYGGDGKFNSCDGSYSMNFEIVLGKYGNQGKFGFTLTRNK